MEEQVIPTTNAYQPKEEWSKPELIVIAVRQSTLGVIHHGGDFYSSSS